MPKFSDKRGFAGHAGKDDSDWLVGDSNPWQHEASGHGYSARYDDNFGWRRGEQSLAGDQAHQSRGSDDASFAKPSWTGDADSPVDIYDVVDGVTGPAGDMLTGGGPLPYRGKSKRDGSK
jgi:hypothetical protein